MRIVLWVLGAVGLVCIVNLVNQLVSKNKQEDSGVPPDDRYPLF